MFNIALYEPNIPQNTGNIIRLIANNGFHLHLIEPLGFDLKDKNLKRSGLDYHDLANVTLHKNYDEFSTALDGKRIFAITTKGCQFYNKVKFIEGDVFLFGSETAGLPDLVRNSIPTDMRLRIPMKPNNRSMNLSNSVAIVSFEAWSQFEFNGGN